MFYKDNWLSWKYDDVKFGNKITPQSKFEFQFKKTINRTLRSHKQELLENTRIIRDSFNEPFDLLFSGGVDSEIVLRCHVELKIPINVFIFKYENDYNCHDVRHALRICEELNVTPTVIDFNLAKFFETDAYDIWKTGFFAKAGRLPHMKMLDYLDNIPVMGDGDPVWVFKENQWLFELGEINHSQSIYCNIINRTSLCDWFEYSPKVIVSHMNLKRIQNLISSSRNEVAYYDQTKYFLYKDIWPEVVIRPKRVGYEQFDTRHKFVSQDLIGMLEFQKMIDSKNVSDTCLYLTKEEFISLIV
jgi:hypothetical protein